MAEEKVTVNLGDRQVVLQIQSLDGLRLLAACIGELLIPEKSMVHVEKMLQCKVDEYSLSFYESAVHLMSLLKSEYTLEDAVSTIAGEILPVEDIPYGLYWGDRTSVMKHELIVCANKLQGWGIEGTDSRLAKRILSRKAAVGDWKLLALRFSDIRARTAADDRNFYAFFKDETRAIMECAELKKYTKKVSIRGNEYVFEQPLHPPWNDVREWDDDRYGRGYGDFSSSMEISLEEDDVSCWETDEERDVGALIRGASSSAAANVSTVKEPTVSLTKILPTTMGPSPPSSLYMAVAAVVEKPEASTHMPSKSIDKVYLKSNVPAATSHKILPPSEWPSLPAKSAKSAAQYDVGGDKQQLPTVNAWTTSVQKRGFMNGGTVVKHWKLDFVPPPTADTNYMIDIGRAFSIEEVWGHALQGQYVGRFPGHRAILDMIKSWGVRAKHRMEEGWLIFNFDTTEDKDKILIGGPYMINGRPLIVKNVPDKFAFTNEDFATIPL